MNDNINEMLNISDNTDLASQEELSLSEEKTLNVIANIVLILGIISSLILFFTIALIHKSYLFGEDQTDLNTSGLVITLGVLLSSIAFWAFFRVISNISISLKELNRHNS